MKVEFTIPETDVRAECGCGHVSWGDSAVDAFKNWWQHKYEAHRDVYGQRWYDKFSGE